MSAASHRSRAAAPPAGVLFDMDGTLVDTEPYWIECEYELVERFGDSWDDEKAHSLVGFDLRDAARELQSRGGVQLDVDDIVNRLLDGVIARMNRSVPWRPGAVELLADLNAAGIPCAMVTMSWQRLADAVVSMLPEGTFAAVISGDMVTNGKPHPEPYLAGARALRAPAHHCVAVEDSPTGIRSAVAARCITYAVPNVVDIAPGEGYTVVRSLAEIPRSALGLAPAARQPRRQPAQRTSRRTPDQQHRRKVLTMFAALITVLGAAAAGLYLTRQHDAPPPYPDMALSVWAPYWELDAATASITANGAAIHQVSPFWYTAENATTVAYSANITVDDTTTFEAAARASGAIIIPTVTDGTGGGEMAAILADPAARAQHVQALVRIAQPYDGIDIDYEAFAFNDAYATWETTRPNWVLFVQELAAALHADGKLLVVTIPPVYDTERTTSSGRWVYDPKAMGELADVVRVMAYDYSFETPGPIAPIEWVQGIVHAMKQLIDDDSKIVLGVPLYGRNWVTGTQGVCPEGTPGRVSPTQVEVAALVQQYAIVPTHDPAVGEATFTYQRPDDTGVCTQTREVHFVDAIGVLARVDLARSERIGGVVFWAMGFDMPDTWTAVAPVARPR